MQVDAASAVPSGLRSTARGYAVPFFSLLFLVPALERSLRCRRVDMDNNLLPNTHTFTHTHTLSRSRLLCSTSLPLTCTHMAYARVSAKMDTHSRIQTNARVNGRLFGTKRKRKKRTQTRGDTHVPTCHKDPYMMHACDLSLPLAQCWSCSERHERMHWLPSCLSS